MRRMFQIRVLWIFVLVVTLLVGCGVDGKHSVDLSMATVGVLYSTTSGNKSKIEWLDEDFNVIGMTDYPFSGGYISFTNANVQDGIIYMTPEGEEQEKDYGKAVIIDPKTNQFEEIVTDRINPIGCSVEGDKMVVTSNLNGESFVDLIDLNSKLVQGVKITEAGLICMEVILVNGEIYASAVKSDGKNYICKCDIDTGQINIIYELPDEDPVTYFEKHGNDLLFLSKGNLIKYDTEKKNMTQVELSQKDALNINVAGDIIWIAYTDYFDYECESLLEARDYISGEILCRYEHQGAVLQMESDENNLFISGCEMLYHYGFHDNMLTLEKKRECKQDTFYYGGLFYLDSK